MLQKRMPLLYERITKADSALLSLSLGWFMNIFINYLPVTTVVRLWDVIMLEGDKCLLRFAMALLAMNEEELLQSEDDSVLSSRFRWERRGEVRRRQMGQFLFDVDALLGLAYKKHNPLLGDTSFFPFKRMEIERMRETKRREILGKAVWASSTRVVIDSDDDLGVCCMLIITSNNNPINPQQISILSIHNKHDNLKTMKHYACSTLLLAIPERESMLCSNQFRFELFFCRSPCQSPTAASPTVMKASFSFAESTRSGIALIALATVWRKKSWK